MKAEKHIDTYKARTVSSEPRLNHAAPLSGLKQERALSEVQATLFPSTVGDNKATQRLCAKCSGLGKLRI